MIVNLKDCYIKFGGDFDEVLGRLRREQIVQKTNGHLIFLFF